MDAFDFYAKAHERYAQEHAHGDVSAAGGEIRQIDGRKFVSLFSRRHRLLAAYEVLSSSLRPVHDNDDLACIRDGAGRIQHEAA